MPEGQKSIGKYGALVDQAFAKFYPNWESTSPFDPIKVVSESFSETVRLMEERHQQLLDTVVDSLPSLFSFAPKSSSLPSVRLFFRPIAGLREDREVSDLSPFEVVVGDQTYELVSQEPVLVQPIQQIEFIQEGKRLRIPCQLSGNSRQFSFYFSPEESQKVPVPSILKYECQVPDSGGQKRNISQQNIRILDERSHDGGSGYIRFEILKAETIDAECEFTVEFDSELPSGQWSYNSARCALQVRHQNKSLGMLFGHPWEEIPLPESILRPPPELRLEMPDGSKLRLAQMHTDILKLKATSYEKYQKGYFYNAANHCLVIPESNLLVGDFYGGVEVVASNVIEAPEAQLKREELETAIGALSDCVESVCAVDEIEPFMGRESKEDYLSRFYQEMRYLQSAGTRDPDSAIMRQALLARVGALRGVDVHVNDIDKSVTAYPVADQKYHRLLSEVERSSASHLKDLLPVGWKGQVAALREAELDVAISIDIQIDESRRGVVSRSQLSERIVRETSRLLEPAPFGMLLAEECLDLSRLSERLSDRLSEYREDGSHLMSHEIKSVAWLSRFSEEDRYQSSVTRPSGRYFVPRVSVRLRGLGE